MNALAGAESKKAEPEKPGASSAPAPESGGMVVLDASVLIGHLDNNAALNRLGVRELALGDEASSRLARLRADLGIKLPDCCVLLAAQEHVGAVASFDGA